MITLIDSSAWIEYLRPRGNRAVADSVEEIHKQDHRELDNIIFGALGLTSSEREEVYQAVVELVSNRLKKARSV